MPREDKTFNRGTDRSGGEYVRRIQAVRGLRIPGAGLAERAVLAVLINRWPKIYASERVLATEAWGSVRTFRRACAVLVGAGVLEVDRRGHANRRGATNAYLLKWDRIYELAEPSGGLVPGQEVGANVTPTHR